jgi:hypothetical protein
LLVDFKPGTAESQRLKADILSSKFQIGLHEIRNVIRGEAEPMPQPSELRHVIREKPSNCHSHLNAKTLPVEW